MIRILHDTHFDFIKWWRWAAGLTIGFIVIGLLSFAFRGGINYSIEFTGGTLVQLQFQRPVETDVIRAALEADGIHGAEITQFGSPREFTVRAQSQATGGADAGATRIEHALRQRMGQEPFRIVRTEAVGPKVGGELRRAAAIAMLLGSLITMVYLAIRFEWRFGLAAVISSLHDVLVTLAFIKLMHLEVSLMIVAGILTLLGYSMNDTIIIFDRARENLHKSKREDWRELLNRSINETLPRSVLTHTTTFAASLALLLFAGEVLRPFAWVMAFGVVVATFSSIYVASPVLLWIEKKFPRKGDTRLGGSPHKGGSSTSRSRPQAPEPVGAP